MSYRHPTHTNDAVKKLTATTPTVSIIGSIHIRAIEARSVRKLLAWTILVSRNRMIVVGGTLHCCSYTLCAAITQNVNTVRDTQAKCHVDLKWKWT